MAAGMTKLSVVVSVATVLLFLPIAALVRRFIPAWREGDRLVYVLTVLARDGRVTHARVEAASGSLIDEL